MIYCQNKLSREKEKKKEEEEEEEKEEEKKKRLMEKSTCMLLLGYFMSIFYVYALLKTLSQASICLRNGVWEILITI